MSHNPLWFDLDIILLSYFIRCLHISKNTDLAKTLSQKGLQILWNKIKRKLNVNLKELIVKFFVEWFFICHVLYKEVASCMNIRILNFIHLVMESDFQWKLFLWAESILKLDSRLPKKCYLLHWKSFKNDEKCFLFHLKSFFCSQDI